MASVLRRTLLILAMLFFLFLPIADRRTVQMKLFVLCAVLAVFAASLDACASS